MISSDEVKDKIPAEDKEALEKAIEDDISWLDANHQAEKEEYEEKQKALEGVAMPILQKMAGGGVTCQEVCQVACLVLVTCLTWEEWEAQVVDHLPQMTPQADQPLRILIKLNVD